MKNSQKNFKNTSRCDEYNGVKFFSKIRSFNIFFGHLKLNQKRKGKKWDGPLKPTW